jgi:hypothetical protein
MYNFKKISATLMMAGLLVGFSACSSDEVATPDEEGTDGFVSFVCQAPAMPASAASRAYSDGQTADNLYYAIYTRTVEGTDTTFTLTETNVGGTALSANKPYTFNNEAKPKTTVSIRVATGQDYTVLFFGAADNAPYKFSPRDKTITVDYENALCNDESRDAFYARYDFTAAKTNPTFTVTLRRPFAQINVGTKWADWNVAAKHSMTPAKTSFKVYDAYHTLDMISGAVSDKSDETFELAALPSGEVFPKLKDDGTSDYAYLSMNYVLAPQSNDANYSGENFKVEFATDTYAASGDSWVIENVPFHRNHRTNIFGDGMLTFTQTVEVEIDPAYDLDDYNYSPYAQFVAWTARTTADATLELMGDIEYASKITINNPGTSTLKLNGHTITFTSESLTGFAAEGTLNIVGPGTIITKGGTAIEAAGNVTLENVTVKIDNASSSKAALTTKNSGTITITGDNGYYQPAQPTTAVVATAATATIEGGVFESWNPASKLAAGLTTTTFEKDGKTCYRVVAAGN